MKSLMTFEIPSKTFILGEYLALRGTSSLILTSDPSFQISVGEGSSHFSPASPAGEFVKRHKLDDFSFSIKDPHEGRGGFGCSTAEFLAAYTFQKIKERESHFSLVSSHMLMELEEMVTEYRDCAGKDYKPSGADLVAQLTGGLCLYDGMNFNSEAKAWPFPGYDLMVFRTGKKIKTHDHLKGLRDSNFQELMPLLLRGLIALQGAQLKPFCHALNDYYDKLNDYQLCDTEVRKKVLTLRENPNVLAAKGCGAMGVDTVALIALESDRKAVVEAAGWLKLEFVTSIKDVHGGMREISQ